MASRADGVRAGPNQYGARTLVAQASTVDPRLWLPVPEPTSGTQAFPFAPVRRIPGDRAVANGMPHPR